MKKHLKTIGILFLCTGVFLLSAGVSYADVFRKLNGDEVARFVTSLEPVISFSKKIAEENPGQASAIMNNRPDSEDMNLTTRNVRKFKEEHPEKYKMFGVITAQFGFESPEDWASVGDAVMLAFLGAHPEFEAIARNAEENMTPENIAKMPPAAQEQTKIVVAMIKQMRDVPPSNIEAVRPHYAQIEKIAQGMQQ